MRRLALILALSAAAAGQPAAAQLFGRPKPPPPSTSTAMPQIDCAAMARMPGAPMTFEACQALMAQAGVAQRNLNSTEGQRPGDQSMTCPQIMAEMAAQPGFVGVSKENARESAAAAANLTETNRRLQAEGAALAAAQAPLNIGAAVASQLPGGNIAATAAARAQAAQQQAFAARAQPQMKQAESRAVLATANSLGDANAAIEQNPRAGALGRLAAAKNCHG
ncbi:hypothetical protein BH11PSE2_BH11PSE2_10420 [soil metagenome]